MTEPKQGQLRGIGLRPDPQEILIAPYEQDGKTWGYTIINKDEIPAMFMDGEWREVIPEGVWIQMKENWNGIKSSAKEVFEEYPEYLEYPEIKELLNG
jgi:hypothetical protein